MNHTLLAGRLYLGHFAGLGLLAIAGAQNAVIHVCVDFNGHPANSVSTDPQISSDGRFVVFKSSADNLTPGTPSRGIFVRDLENSVTLWASPMPDGSIPVYDGQTPSISDDGRFAAFDTLSAMTVGDIGAVDVFVRDIQGVTTVRASVSQAGGQPNGDSYPSKISGDGRYIAFLSLATNLVPNDLNGNHFAFGRDIFLRDLAAAATELLNISSSGVQGNASADDFDLSFDGRYVVFVGGADNLVMNDNNGASDIFLRDRALSQTTRINLSGNGSEANASSFFPSISADGRFIAFDSEATNLVLGDTNGSRDAFVVDRQAATIERVSINDVGLQGNDGSFGPSVSDNGRWICFRSSSTNLALGDADIHANVFLHDRRAKTTRKVDRSPAGAHPDDFASVPQISADGFSVTYDSLAKNILPGASNNWVDVFVVRHQELSPAVYCTGTTNSQGCVPSMSWDGAPSVNASNSFTLLTTQLLPNRQALFVYGISGPASLPLHGTTQCVTAPLFRTPPQSSAGSVACSGSISIDFNSFAVSGTHPLLVAGRSVWAQCWSRDPQASSTQSLSDAVFFVLEP